MPDKPDDDKDNQSKVEFALTAPAPKPRVQRQPPTLIQVGPVDADGKLIAAKARWVTSDGRYHSILVADYAGMHGLTRWLQVHELSKVFTTRTKNGKTHIRKNMVKVFDHCLSRGQFLVYLVTKRGRIDAVKLLDYTSREEVQAAGPQLDRMRKKRELSTEKYEKAVQVLATHERMLAEQLVLAAQPADEPQQNV